MRTYDVIVRHSPMTPGCMGREYSEEAYHEAFGSPLAAACALLAQIEGGTYVPTGRHGYLFIRDIDGIDRPLNEFCRKYNIKLPRQS